MGIVGLMTVIQDFVLLSVRLQTPMIENRTVEVNVTSHATVNWYWLIALVALPVWIAFYTTLGWLQRIQPSPPPLLVAAIFHLWLR